MPLCRHCEKNEAETSSLGWLGLLPLLLGLMPLSSGRYCKDCATGIQLPGLLLFVVLLIVGFVVMVIKWG